MIFQLNHGLLYVYPEVKEVFSQPIPNLLPPEYLLPLVVSWNQNSGLMAQW